MVNGSSRIFAPQYLGCAVQALRGENARRMDLDQTWSRHVALFPCRASPISYAVTGRTPSQCFPLIGLRPNR